MLLSPTSSVRQTKGLCTSHMQHRSSFPIPYVTTAQSALPLHIDAILECEYDVSVIRGEMRAHKFGIADRLIRANEYCGEDFLEIRQDSNKHCDLTGAHNSSAAITAPTIYCDMSTASSQSFSSIAMAVTTIFVTSIHRLLTTIHPARGPATMAAYLTIGMLILRARMRRWELAWDRHEGQLETDVSAYGDEKKASLSGEIELALAKEAQTGDIVPVNDMGESTNTLSIEEGSWLSGKVQYYYHG
ncbi:uncharacterized protein BT62DRAFT_1079737 [Guyanagaster necrorhizus]|uniref:Uncharacterized protein n=1 Tax=Guyanagaster necrorhizus TaxID=856835 RepID=A0A9P7VJT7_9AGAR|nr:uncharacterized protein BT62DRAFT_1079737 [Guyanagaster necrorhizus MCA 3950]KAG7442014.1 hypothetical protein BT62DRAFT_1079737 [Guyanagaster necrorhizus MCA 3950]